MVAGVTTRSMLSVGHWLLFDADEVEDGTEFAVWENVQGLGVLSRISWEGYIFEEPRGVMLSDETINERFEYRKLSADQFAQLEMSVRHGVWKRAAYRMWKELTNAAP